MSNPAFLPPKAGTIVEHAGKSYKITHILSLTAFLAENVADGTVEKLKIDEIRTLSNPNAGDAVVECREINTFSDDEWKLAQYRFECIRPLIQNDFRTRKDAELAAASAGVHVATIYSWMKAWEQDGHLSALIPRPRGRKEGVTLLTSEQETIIESVIDEMYLDEQRFTPTDVIEEVNTQCKVAKIKPPHGNTVRARIKQIDRKYALKRRGRRDKASNLFDPVTGEFPGADCPLAVVQIDHTPANIIVVDEITRETLGKPWLTLAIDVYSRVVVGAYVSMDHPSAVAAGVCLARSILPKTGYLEQIGVPGEWPVYGKMHAVHADNAKEFRGKMLQKSCKQYFIDLELRPVKKPKYGAHIERLMGVASRQLEKLPGTTFANIQEREGYDSEKKAAMTMKEVEQHLVDFIVNIYHRRVHTGINSTPLKKWELGVLGNDDELGTGLPQIPGDPDKLILDFLPFEERTVQNYGIQLDKIYYYHEVLNKWINSIDPEDNKRKRKFIVRRHPNDISKVYFYDPDAETYYVIPYRNTSYPAISVWELRKAQEKLKEDAIAEVDEDKIFESVLRMRERVNNAKKETKAVRKAKAKIKDTETSSRRSSPSSVIGIAVENPPSQIIESTPSDMDAFDDIDFDDIKPFSDREAGLKHG